MVIPQDFIHRLQIENYNVHANEIVPYESNVEEDIMCHPNF